MSTAYHSPPAAVSAMPRTAQQVTMNRVSWGAIAAGSVIALAVMILLTSLGIGIGGATVDPMLDRNPLAGVPTASAVFMVVAQLIALGAGGYVAARLAGVPRLVSSMLHGAAVWAVAVLSMVYLATTSIGALVSGSASMFASAVSGVASAAESVVPDDLQLPDMTLPNVEMSDLPKPVQDALRKQGLTAQNFKQEARKMLRSVVSKQEQQSAANAVSAAASDVITSPGDAMADVDALIGKLVGPNAVFSDEDREEAMSVLRNRFGLSEADAEQMYDRWLTRAQNAAAEVQQALEAAQQQGMEMASAATTTLSTVGFSAFVAFLLALVAAVIGAALGRPSSLVGARADDHADVNRERADT